MLPPGLGFNAISEKARAAAKTNRMPRSYWDWEEMLKPNAAGFFPYTPATNLLYGLREAIAMLLEEGLDKVFARHQRLAAATRAAVDAWGLEVLCLEPAEYSPVLTAVLMPPGHDADEFRKIVLDNYNMSLGSGLGKVAGKVFRIGHLGECNELTLMGALSGVEMGLAAAGVPHRAGGVDAAMASLEARTDVEFARASEGGQDLTHRRDHACGRGRRRAAKATRTNAGVRECGFGSRPPMSCWRCCASCTSSPISTGSISARPPARSRRNFTSATPSLAWCSRPLPIRISCSR